MFLSEIRFLKAKKLISLIGKMGVIPSVKKSETGSNETIEITKKI